MLLKKIPFWPTLPSNSVEFNTGEGVSERTPFKDIQNILILKRL